MPVNSLFSGITGVSIAMAMMTSGGYRVFWQPGRLVAFLVRALLASAPKAGSPTDKSLFRKAL
jgi:hypothetical protein